ncbi:MAG: nitroreductase family protein [Candidatus Hodarchaeota archaeon]
MKDRSIVLDIIRYRRSIRQYDPKPIEAWKLDAILEAARLAPSSSNSQPWRIIIVTDPALKAQLGKATPANIKSYPWMNDTPVILALCSVKSKEHKIGQLIGKNYEMVDMGVVGEHIVLTATELGLATCWIGWFHKTKTKRILKIPRLWKVVCLIPIGYPKKNNISFEEMVAKYKEEGIQQVGEPGIGDKGAKIRRPLDEIVFYNQMEKKNQG